MFSISAARIRRGRSISVMRNLFFHTARPALPRQRLAVLVGLIVLVMTGCSSPGSDDGVVAGSVDPATQTVTGEIVLPTDTLLNLYCANVGLVPTTCVLEDPENPYRETATLEFDVNNPDPDQLTKFDLFIQLPAGPTGAKARFYLWATALARFPSGENQWYTALALHELWDAAEPATDHPYLTRKGIEPHGVRIKGGRLVIPIRDTEGTLHTVQTIAADGDKHFPKDGKKQGHYFWIGKPLDGMPLCICE